MLSASWNRRSRGSFCLRCPDRTPDDSIISRSADRLSRFNLWKKIAPRVGIARKASRLDRIRNCNVIAIIRTNWETNSEGRIKFGIMDINQLWNWIVFKYGCLIIISECKIFIVSSSNMQFFSWINYHRLLLSSFCTEAFLLLLISLIIKVILQF